MWADFAEIRSWRETSTAADFGEIGPHFGCRHLFISDIGPQWADETTLSRSPSTSVTRLPLTPDHSPQRGRAKGNLLGAALHRRHASVA